MRDYLSPERNRVALLTIDAQRDFCMSSGRGKAGCSAPFTAAMTRLTEGFRAKGRPIVHVVRLYRCDGSNVELCNQGLDRRRPAHRHAGHLRRRAPDRVEA